MKQIIKYSSEEIEKVRQNWENLAAEFKGEFCVADTDPNGELTLAEQRKYELRIPFTNEELCLYAVGYNPLKIGYIIRGKQEIEFNLYPEDFSKKVGKLFGLKEHEIGDEEFDNRFIIKGNTKEFILKMLSDDLKSFLLQNYVPVFKLERNHGISNLELNIVINEVKYDQLKTLIELMKKVILTIKAY
ncbi:MAG: hypothetical protein C0599_13410 [Salinivirgaceae bacterium]|nr:MAG: hypothetical protein C0599_13410 [Salinivirgaceae bacterium]